MTSLANRPSVAIALGGGGARGLAHILMLEVLDEMHIKPTLIVGTSIGAIFGAAYAAGLSAKLIRAHAEEVLGRRFSFAQSLIAARAEPVLKLLRILPIRSSVLSPTVLMDQVLPSKIPADFAGLGIPFKAVATDFYSQEQVVIGSGDLKSAIAASIALPALFSGVVRDGRLLMDGGLVNPLPFDLLEGAADITVAVDVTGASSRHGKRLQPTAVAALASSSQILQRSIVREKLKTSRPDVYIDVDVDRFHVLEFHRLKEILAAATPAKEQLQRQLDRVLSSQMAETVTHEATVPPRRRRLAGLRRLALRRPE
ncbi:MAG TPA: patatin-like phospholipase family protein [Hyphomicrobiaceae bacterium]|nr:patatin-like phospholipase family protein [Hyphomicrobiaceae bacterium]